MTACPLDWLHAKSSRKHCGPVSLQIREMDELVAAEAAAAAAAGLAAHNSSRRAASEHSSDAHSSGNGTNAAAAADAGMRLQQQLRGEQGPLQGMRSWWRRRRRRRKQGRARRRQLLLQPGAVRTGPGAAAERDSWHAEGGSPSNTPLHVAAHPLSLCMHPLMC